MLNEVNWKYMILSPFFKGGGGSQVRMIMKFNSWPRELSRSDRDFFCICSLTGDNNPPKFRYLIKLVSGPESSVGPVYPGSLGRLGSEDQRRPVAPIMKCLIST